jgi:hypothetical protein
MHLVDHSRMLEVAQASYTHALLTLPCWLCLAQRDLLMQCLGNLGFSGDMLGALARRRILACLTIVLPSCSLAVLNYFCVL